MKLRSLLSIGLCICMMLPFVACDADPLPTAEPSPTAATPTAEAEATVTPVENSNTLIDAADYTYLWWGNGLDASTSFRHAYVQTGHYGLSVDANTGKIMCVGGLKGIPQEEAAADNNSTVKALPKMADTDMTLDDGKSVSHVYMSSYVHNDAFPMSSSSWEGAGAKNAMRIISSGTYMQRFDIFQLLYKETEDYTARAEYAAVANYFTFTYDAQPQKETEVDVNLAVTMTLDKSYNKVATVKEGKAYIFSREDGQCIAYIADEANGDTIAVNGNSITFSGNANLKAEKWNGISMAIMPGLNLTEKDVLSYYAARKVSVTAKNVEPTDTGDATVEYNAVNGALTIGMPNSKGFTNYNLEENRTAYERTPFTITNDSDYDTTVTVCFSKPKIYPNANYGLWGMAPMLFDSQTHEPTGIAVQYSRNPHNYISYSQILYGACWTDSYVYIKVPAHQTVGYDFVCAFYNWGQTASTSIAQMCLVGWGGNQWWYSASYGSRSGYGETFGFDPEMGCGRSLIDDTTPFNYGGAGAGGGDWLHIKSAYGNAYQKITKVKTNVRTVGPNVSQLDVSGYLTGDAAYCQMSIFVTRADDYAKMTNRFTYTFLNEVKFSRLALWQLGADNYNDRKMGKLAYGLGDNVTEILTTDEEVKIGNLKYARQYIEAPINTWVAQYDFYYTGDKPAGNKGMVIREFSAKIGDKTYDTPTISVFVTNNDVQNLNAEITLPKEVGESGVIPAGSVISGTVEYIALPGNKGLYTGKSNYILSFTDEQFTDYTMVKEYAKDGEIKVSAAVGTVTDINPANIACVAGNDVVAEFTVSGGIGYVPVTLTNLPSYSGYRLYKVTASGEELVDQSVKGNDYWQCFYNAESRTYELSFNVFQVKETCTYRLKKTS